MAQVAVASGRRTQVRDREAEEMAEQVAERTVVVGRHMMVAVPRAGDRDVWETHRRGCDLLAQAARGLGVNPLGVAVAGITAQELQLTALLSH